MSGGYRAAMRCDGVTLTGFGTTRAEAQQHAQAPHNLYAETGLECDGRSVDARKVRYRATVACETEGLEDSADGYGQTLTEAMNESRELIALYARYGRLCAARASDARQGGYGATLRCETGSLNDTLDGFGTTFNDAAFEARGLATLWAKTGRFCGGTTSDAISGGYRVRLAPSTETRRRSPGEPPRWLEWTTISSRPRRVFPLGDPR